MGLFEIAAKPSQKDFIVSEIFEGQSDMSDKAVVNDFIGSCPIRLFAPFIYLVGLIDVRFLRCQTLSPLPSPSRANFPFGLWCGPRRHI